MERVDIERLTEDETYLLESAIASFYNQYSDWHERHRTNGTMTDEVRNTTREQQTLLSSICRKLHLELIARY